MSHSIKRIRRLQCRGIGVSSGVVLGEALVIETTPTSLSVERIKRSDIEEEVHKFEKALIKTRHQLRSLQSDLHKRGAGNDIGFLDAHLMLLDDRSFVEGVVNEIKKNARNVAAAVSIVSEHHASLLGSVHDVYLRERVADIRDIARRIIMNLSDGSTRQYPAHSGKHIIVAHDLSPTETASLHKELVLGFATDIGSATSHTALLARALGIPAVVALHDVTSKVKTGDRVLLDGTDGILIVNPTREQLEKHDRTARIRKRFIQRLAVLRKQPAETKDGKRIIIEANIEASEEIEGVLHYGAQGVGLLRSEYLYMAKGGIMNEDEESRIYARIAQKLAPHFVIVRTLDVGGDKFFFSKQKIEEPNPFLGCRSIRLSLQYPEHFKAQLRAILRANVLGNIKIMYPMISSLDELLIANKYLEEAKKELKAKGEKFVPDIEVGAMIEVPSAVMTADVLAQHVRFFSLGTNDLIQYSLAVDRSNDRVAYLYQPAHPAILKLIMQTIVAGHQAGIRVGICGEMGGAPLFTQLLLGLGVDEISMVPSAIPIVKYVIRNSTFIETRSMVARALLCKTAGEVMELCKTELSKTVSDVMELIHTG